MPIYSHTPLLTSVERVALLLKQNAITDMTLIANSLNVASQLTRNWCNRHFDLQTLTDEVYSGDGTNELILDCFPITEVTAIKIIDDSNAETSLAIATDIILNPRDAAMGLIKINPRSTVTPYYYFPEGESNIKVTYKGGWTTIPEAVQEGVASWAADICLQLKHDPSLASETIGKYSYTNKTSSGSSFSGRADPPDAVKIILGQYRNVL